MTLHIDFAPQIEEWINTEAQLRGLLPVDLVRRVVEERVATAAVATKLETVIDPKNLAAIEYLTKRLQDEHTDDPDEIQKADEDVKELMRNMNANRAATGERLVFPE